MSTLKKYILYFLLLVMHPCLANTIDDLSLNSVTPLKNLPHYQRNLLANPQNIKCHKQIKELVVVKVPYLGFDGKAYQGILLVHRSLGNEVVEIFQALFDHRFPIQAMMPIPLHLKKNPQIYSNITASFNCRAVTGQPGILSQHSYGRAIDINPFLNPYVKNCLVIPGNSEKHISRFAPKNGKMIPNTYVVHLFEKYGWDWGGNWYDLLDYQHFEKRADGEKRDPFGYKTPYFRYKIGSSML